MLLLLLLCYCCYLCIGDCSATVTHIWKQYCYFLCSSVFLLLLLLFVNHLWRGVGGRAQMASFQMEVDPAGHLQARQSSSSSSSSARQSSSSSCKTAQDKNRRRSATIVSHPPSLPSLPLLRRERSPRSSALTSISPLIPLPPNFSSSKINEASPADEVDNSIWNRLLISL